MRTIMCSGCHGMFNPENVQKICPRCGHVNGRRTEKLKDDGASVK